MVAPGLNPAWMRSLDTPLNTVNTKTCFIYDPRFPEQFEAWSTTAKALLDKEKVLDAVQREEGIDDTQTTEEDEEDEEAEEAEVLAAMQEADLRIARAQWELEHGKRQNEEAADVGAASGVQATGIQRPRAIAGAHGGA